jgi:hypothetical protein
LFEKKQKFCNKMLRQNLKRIQNLRRIRRQSLNEKKREEIKKEIKYIIEFELDKCREYNNILSNY